jgi:hypothetical protein
MICTIRKHNSLFYEERLYPSIKLRTRIGTLLRMAREQDPGTETPWGRIAHRVEFESGPFSEVLMEDDGDPYEPRIRRISYVCRDEAFGAHVLEMALEMHGPGRQHVDQTVWNVRELKASFRRDRYVIEDPTMELQGSAPSPACRPMTDLYARFDVVQGRDSRDAYEHSWDRPKRVRKRLLGPNS